MKFGVDTYSWTKFFLLLNTNWKVLIEEILKNSKFFITNQVRNELEYFHTSYRNYWESIEIMENKLPVNFDYDRIIFDEADISLLELVELDDIVIITEDRPMLAKNITKKNNIISLVDFFALLYKKEVISSRELYHITKWLEKKKNITKKKTKLILNIISGKEKL